MLSYASGPSSLPLLGETIGENLRRTVLRHGDSEALVVPHQGYRATYRQLWEQVSLAARGLIEVGFGSIVVIDAVALRRFANGD